MPQGYCKIFAVNMTPLTVYVRSVQLSSRT